VEAEEMRSQGAIDGMDPVDRDDDASGAKEEDLPEEHSQHVEAAGAVEGAHDLEHELVGVRADARAVGPGLRDHERPSGPGSNRSSCVPRGGRGFADFWGESPRTLTT